MDTETQIVTNNRWRITKSGRAMICIVIVLLLLLAVSSAFFAYVAAYDKIYPGIVVSDINLSGKTKTTAGELLSAKYDGAIAQNSVKLICNGKTAELKLNELSAGVNIDATAEAAYLSGRDGNIFQNAGVFLAGHFSQREIEPQIVIDEELLTDKITELVSPFETPKADNSYELNGNTLTLIKGNGGIEVDRNAAINQVKHEIAHLTFNQIALTPVPVEPEPFDTDKLYDELTSAAVDAKYVRDGSEIVVDGGKPQVIMEKSKLKELIDSGEGRASAQVEVVQPANTKEKLEGLLFRDKMGTYSSKYNPSNVARSSNVILAASRINGVILLPGETFSYDTTVKPRTAANGYKEAPVYVGNKVESGIGGGICQTSSTLYSAVLYSNLEVVTRTSHSLPVSYMPAGQDATIAQGSIDFKFRNNTDYPIKIVASAGSGTVVCSIMGTKLTDFKVQIVNQNHSYTQPSVRREYDASVPKGSKKVAQKGAGGYSTSSTRIVTENGVEVKRETLSSSRYNPTETIEVVNPEDKNTPSDQLTVYTGKPNSENTDSPEPGEADKPQPSAQPAETEQNQDDVTTVDI